jgi:hypothetical protein
MAERSKLPKDIGISKVGTIIGQELVKGFLITDARSNLKVIEADPILQRDLIANGYEVLSHDNEGFEAEIFFSRGIDYVGTYSLHDLCDGQIRIKLVLGAPRYDEKKN